MRHPRIIDRDEELRIHLGRAGPREITPGGVRLTKNLRQLRARGHQCQPRDQGQVSAWSK